MLCPQEVTLSSRESLIQDALLAGRESSTASVLLHSVIAERLGLSATDTKTLDVLLRHGPLTAGQLAEHTGLATASVTSLIDRLERRGYVERVRDTADRRRVFVHAKPESLAAFEPHMAGFVKGLEELLQGYSDEELAAIARFMRAAAELARAEAARLGKGE